LLEGISTGGEDWLVVVASLFSGADGATANELQSAVGYALERAPANVLGVSEVEGVPPFSLLTVCVAGIMEEEPTLEAARGRTALRKSTVRRVQDAKLADRRDRCLRELEVLEGDLPKHFVSR
jgi:hypothetical protein